MDLYESKKNNLKFDYKNVLGGLLGQPQCVTNKSDLESVISQFYFGL